MEATCTWFCSRSRKEAGLTVNKNNSLMHVYVIVSTLSMSYSIMWGVQDGRIYVQCDEQIGAAAFIYRA